MKSSFPFSRTSCRGDRSFEVKVVDTVSSRQIAIEVTKVSRSYMSPFGTEGKAVGLRSRSLFRFATSASLLF